ncbi:MAG: glycoside hydrolase family 3 C-terminal domain-containing protein [Bryobacteraceae bacterium]|nr:glycoside hydrolase family 3 C-terminal domain-containing protein [Bryobacteraceae bacterium]
MTLRVICLISAAAILFPQTAPRFRNPDAPLEQRVEDLVSRMTLDEKIAQMSNDAPAIPRLGVPAHNWWNECLHGVARAGRATVFPQAIGLAATWDTEFLHKTASAVSDEARAKHHEFARRGKFNIYQGLTFWTPNINLFRDPRWGRGMETYGEDPYLTGRLAVAFIRGLQGDDPKYLKVVATAKHYAVHSGPESERHTFDARVSERDLLESYLPHFEMAVKEGGARSVMCAYNRVYGDAACASPRLLGEILRKQWGFPGYVVSDCGAIDDIYKRHKIVPTLAEAAALAVKAGTDLNCGVEYAGLRQAVEKGLIAESEIDTAVRRLFTARFRLGMFDPPERVKYARIPYSVNDSAEHRQLALEAARKSIVLLKNDSGLLPLKKSIKTLAVIGPNSNDPEVMLANYNGDPSAPVTPLEGIRRKLGASTRVIHARGSDLAAGMPTFETVPASALFQSNGPDRQPGLKGEYYNTANFSGTRTRVRELTHPNSGQMVGEVPQNPRPLFTRVDSTVAFRWWDGAPRSDMNDDDFGVRWTGYLAPPVTGEYRLGAIGFNAFELYLDEKRIAGFNNIHERGYEYAQVKLEAGKLYALRLDFHHFVNDADIRLVWQKPGEDLESEAMDAVRQAEAVVMFLGLSPRLEGEEMRVPVEGFSGGDRVTLSLPRVQEELLAKVVAAGKPAVLVLMNGSAVAVRQARDKVPAIIEAWYPGQAGGAAIADVLFGDYNPGGRLPLTFYESEAQLPPFNNYDMAGRTYRFFKGEPLFAFGYGLSYTRFTYSNLKLPASARAGEKLVVSADVRNAGSMAGDEVVQVYLRQVDAPAAAPLRTLAGFQRIGLRPGERRAVRFTVELPRTPAAGVVEISVGGQQPSARVAPTTQVLTGRVQVGAP